LELEYYPTTDINFLFTKTSSLNLYLEDEYFVQIYNMCIFVNT